MKLTSTQIKIIKKDFNRMCNKSDFVMLLNKVNYFLYADNALPISIDTVSKLSNPTISKKRYKQFSIKKKSGKERIIHAPISELKILQRCIKTILEVFYIPNQAATGFITGKSIIHNAQPHVGKEFIYNVDIKDFFHSIDQARFWKMLHLPPYNLSTTSYRLKIANIIASLCFTELEVDRVINNKTVKIKKNVLPQGGITSPIIINIISQNLDRKLSGLSKRYNATYTRYADDITFSSNINLFSPKREFIKELSHIIEKQNFKLNSEKTRLSKSKYRQEATGLVINSKVNVRKNFIKEVRMWLYYCKRYGLEKAESYYSQKSNPKIENVREHTQSNCRNLVNVLHGKLNFIKMVKGKDDPTLLKLVNRFNKLVKNINNKSATLTNNDLPVYTPLDTSSLQEDLNTKQLRFTLD